MTSGRAFRMAWVPVLALPLLGVLACGDSPSSDDEEAVTEVVEAFLRVAGRYDLDSLSLLFAPAANIGANSRRQDGQWATSTWSAEGWIETLRARTDPRPYAEPVAVFTVHVDNGQLAFVRADATLMRDGRARSHNIDYFTLIRHDGAWKILSASYTAVPAP